MTIKELRLMKGLTLANFAKSIGIGLSTLTGYEAGKRAPSEKALAAIKEVYGVDLNEATPAAPVKEKKAKKPAAKKEKPAPTEKAAPAAKTEKAVKAEPAAKKEKTAKASAKKETKAPAKKEKASKKVEMIIQSPMGGEITADEIMSRIGDVDKVYIRIDQNATYWVKGDESGAINLW